MQIADDEVFVVGAQLDHLDLFVVAHFSDIHPCINFDTTHSYLDRLRVSLCPADVDGDGDGITDFLQVLAAWGPCPDPCVEDIDAAGTVGILDFLDVLSKWGGCSSV